MSEIIQNNSYPKVSIVTPSYNQGKFIEKTILSVLCQDYPNLEYIVVDGLSTDETLDIIRKYEHRINKIILEADKGQTDALNKGFRLCTGEILAYLNSDDCYAAKNVVSKAVDYFKEYQGFDVIYGQRNIIDEFGKLLNFHPYRPFSEPDFYLSDYIPQECTFWTKRIFEKAGAYINEEFDFAMDYELLLRFLKLGAKFLSVEDVFGLFRYYPAQKTSDRWHSHGLPEIAKLHKMYLGRYIEETEMLNYNYEYLFNINPSIYPEAFAFYQRFWWMVIEHKIEIFNNLALDTWMLQ
ncbi:glycosyltransferase [Trichocoleus sp. Lan]|uniref:glycosyltransferase family 2 protein n=1 Tax=Trichocoleus sp. Lan TaxID=2933927 RepID=UPI003299AE7D